MTVRPLYILKTGSNYAVEIQFVLPAASELEVPWLVCMQAGG